MAYRANIDLIHKVRKLALIAKMGLTARDRFLVVVLSAYKQMKAQGENVLSNVDEDNFDRAFKFFRPSEVFHDA